jgi:hypothetical protein
MPPKPRRPSRPSVISYRPGPEMRERLRRYAAQHNWPLAVAIGVILDKELPPLPDNQT